MGKTYCVVPKKRQMFWELVQGMELAEEEAALLQSCTILHVEIDPAANGWEVVLQTPELLDGLYPGEVWPFFCDVLSTGRRYDARHRTGVG